MAVQLKRKIKSLSWKKMVEEEEDGDADLAVAFDKENGEPENQCPLTRSKSGSEVGSRPGMVRTTSRISNNIQETVASGMLSMRNAVVTIRRVR